MSYIADNTFQNGFKFEYLLEKRNPPALNILICSELYKLEILQTNNSFFYIGNEIEVKIKDYLSDKIWD